MSSNLNKETWQVYLTRTLVILSLTEIEIRNKVIFPNPNTNQLIITIAKCQTQMS